MVSGCMSTQRLMLLQKKHHKGYHHNYHHDGYHGGHHY